MLRDPASLRTILRDWAASISIFDINRTFILSEPLHPVGTPFPGGYSVTEEHGTYYCPVKDKQKDNPSALCDICIAEQTP
ncbi:DUF2115 family protein [Methanothermobacter sp.]|uniref:DUF2115 family protein n=1 Tax=Methanothermobacter sp. TaxID=1884223 RepID=UPI003C7608F9